MAKAMTERPRPKSTKSTGKSTIKRAKPSAAPAPAPRLAPLDEADLNAEQTALRDAIASGPRGKFMMGGPFAVFLRAPAFGQLAQQLGGFVRYKTFVPPRLSEFTILATARWWRAQFEWHVHEPIAERAGVKAKAIAELRAGRYPVSAANDEKAIYDFVAELYKTRRVSEKTYARVHALLGEAGTVELVGILGYYALVAMSLNVFHMPLPEGQTPPFREP